MGVCARSRERALNKPQKCRHRRMNEEDGRHPTCGSHPIRLSASGLLAVKAEIDFFKNHLLTLALCCLG